MRIATYSTSPAQPYARDLVVGEWRQDASYTCHRPEGTPNWLLMLTMEGGGFVRNAKGGEHPVRPGDFLLYTPDSYHHYGTAARPGHWDFVWSHFLPLPHWTFLPLGERLWPGLHRLHLPPNTLKRAAACLRSAQSPPWAQPALHVEHAAHQLEALFLLLRDELVTATPPRMDPRLNRVLEHLHRHPEASDTVEALARLAGLSSSRFAHFFREQTGQSPRAYRERLRIRRARHLLRTTHLTVADVATACGFDDPFYFTKRFRHHCGKSPRAYRKSPR